MVKLKRMKSIIACVSVAMLLTGCLSSLVKPESTVTSKVGGGMEELLPPYDGPRAAIAVTDFEWKVGTSKTTIGIGGTDFSFAHEDEVAHTDALKAMLTTALVQSNRFRVIERARVDSIKDEIALQEDGYTNSSGKKRGTLQAPDIQVVAYITGWAPGSSGGGGKIGGALFGKKASALLGDGDGYSHCAC